MFKRRDTDYLGDMLEALEMIREYTHGLTLRQFLADRKTQNAVVRNFEIIGEASKKTSATLRAEHPDVPWRQTAGLRDKLIHFCFGVDYRIVWNILKEELPKLHKQIRAIIKDVRG